VQPAAVSNPYQAPRADLELRSPSPDANAPVASRLQRLGGFLVDILLDSLAHLLVYVGASRPQVRAMGGNVFKLYLHLGTWGYVAGVTVVSLSVVQWSFITRRGQSIGKMVARSRIVRMDGASVDFVHAVMIRNWVLAAPALLLSLSGLHVEPAASQLFAALGLLDALVIFGPGKRCSHDWIAGTKVIDLASPKVEPRPLD
jgi:uncharacterized RDD family membrane protein YckC